MRGKRLLWVIAILVAANFVLGTQVQKKLAENENERLRLFELIPEAEAIIRNNYVEDVETQDLIYGALRGMLDSLDLHSQFLPPAAVKSMEWTPRAPSGDWGLKSPRSKVS
jgi:carboxyl-terminal processing protease